MGVQVHAGPSWSAVWVVIWLPQGPLSVADSATAFGAQSSSQLSQMLTAEAGMPTQPCCDAGEGQAQSCHRAVGRR